MSVMGYPPYKADCGCHVALSERAGDDPMIWHVHDRDGLPVAFFFAEEDATHVADMWNHYAEQHVAQGDSE